MKEQTKKALDFLANRNVLSCFFTQKEWLFKLMDFVRFKGETSLQALAGFYLWTIKNIEVENEQQNLLVSTFAHDLGEMMDENMEPRSSNYLEFWLNRDF